MKKPLRRRSFLFLLLVAFVGAGMGLWAFWFEPASLTVHRQALSLPAWPAAFSGLRVAVLADLHVGSPHNGLDKLARIVDETNALRPDIVLIPGDFVIQGVKGGTFVAPEDAAVELGRLKAPLGVFACLGNHDWWLDGRRVAAALTRRGIPVLEDRAVKINRGGAHFWLVGISDFTEAPHDVGKAFSAVPNQAAVLAFTHNPDVFPTISRPFSLLIAGHTHGGQVHLPVVGRPVVPSEHGQRYAYGHVVENGRHLYVSPGLGTSILPVRFRVPPEVTLLELAPGP